MLLLYVQNEHNQDEGFSLTWYFQMCKKVLFSLLEGHLDTYTSLGPSSTVLENCPFLILLFTSLEFVFCETD